MRYIETIQIRDGRVKNLSYHTTRVRGNSSVTLPDLESLCNIKSGRVKCRIVYNSDSINSIEFMPYTLPEIKTLRVIDAPRINYSKKYLDRSQLDALYSLRAECDDILICRNGEVGDTYFCNIVLEQGGKLYTLQGSLLAGTKRQKLIERGVITPRPIYISELGDYNQIHLINSMIDLEDRVTIDSSQIYIE